MVGDRAFKVGGSNFCWTVRDCAYVDVKRAAEAHGVEQHLPAPPEPKAALYAALKEAVKGDKHLLVRDLREAEVPNAYAVIDETPLAGVLSHREDFRAVLTEDTSYLQITPGFTKFANAIRANYERERLTMPAASVGRFLRQVIEKMGGVAIRPTGGIYWLPLAEAERFHALRVALREFTHGAVEVYRQNVVADEDAAATLVAAVTAEIESDLARIQNEIKNGVMRGGKYEPLGERAMKARVTECAALLRRAESFETMLGVTLSKVEITRTATEAETAFAQLASMGD